MLRWVHLSRLILIIFVVHVQKNVGIGDAYQIELRSHFAVMVKDISLGQFVVPEFDQKSKELVVS